MLFLSFSIRHTSIVIQPTYTFYQRLWIWTVKFVVHWGVLPIANGQPFILPAVLVPCWKSRFPLLHSVKYFVALNAMLPNNPRFSAKWKMFYVALFTRMEYVARARTMNFYHLAVKRTMCRMATVIERRRQQKKRNSMAEFARWRKLLHNKI